MNLEYYLITGIAITGTILNLRKDRRCFYLWGLSNFLFLLQSLLLGAWNLTILFLVYFGLAVYGLRTWRE